MSWQYLAGYLGTMTLGAMAWLGWRRYTRRRKPEPVKHGPLDEWLHDTDIVARRIERMTQQRFVADAILGPDYPRERPSRVRRAWRRFRERVARSGEVE